MQSSDLGTKINPPDFSNITESQITITAGQYSSGTYTASKNGYYLFVVGSFGTNAMSLFLRNSNGLRIAANNGPAGYLQGIASDWIYLKKNTKINYGVTGDTLYVDYCPSFS